MFTPLPSLQVAEKAKNPSERGSGQKVELVRIWSCVRTGFLAFSAGRKQLHLLLGGAESHNQALLMSTASLSGHWEKKISASKGKPYYWIKVTGESTWVLPEEASMKSQVERSLDQTCPSYWSSGVIT
jgi:hypothetical protein